MLVELKSMLVAAAVCPAAPPGMQAPVDEVTSWVKWGVVSLFAIAAVVSIGSLLFGKILHHPQASRGGSIGLAVCVMAAILYVVFPGMLTSIIGSGCS
jgi:hypothetical protein